MSSGSRGWNCIVSHHRSISLPWASLCPSVQWGHWTEHPMTVWSFMPGPVVFQEVSMTLLVVLRTTTR
jgi:hypothetical protein